MIIRLLEMMAVVIKTAILGRFKLLTIVHCWIVIPMGKIKLLKVLI